MSEVIKMAEDMEKIYQRERKNLRGKYIRAFFNKKSTYFVLVVVGLFLICALFPQLIATHDPNDIDVFNTSIKPTAEHLLGTDAYGRDTFSRLIYGTRVSFVVGICTVILASIIGTTLGITAGYFGGLVDDLIMRLSDIIRSIPQVALASSIMLIFKGSAAIGAVKRFNPGIVGLIIILSIGAFPGYIRIARAQVMQIRSADYISARKITGCSNGRIMLKHILPNALSPIIVLMTQGISQTIMAESGLSFLGIGVSEPLPTWGNMLTDGRSYLFSNPISAVVPGICIIILCVCLNLLGDALRDALDPRLRGTL